MSGNKNLLHMVTRCGQNTPSGHAGGPHKEVAQRGHQLARRQVPMVSAGTRPTKRNLLAQRLHTAAPILDTTGGAPGRV
eukprot:2149882-Prymnesium_polylepis.2